MKLPDWPIGTWAVVFFVGVMILGAILAKWLFMTEPKPPGAKIQIEGP